MRLLTLTLPAAVLASGPGWSYDYGNDHACPLASYFGVPSCTKDEIAAEDAVINARWDELATTTDTDGDGTPDSNDCTGYYQSPIEIPIPRILARDLADLGRAAVDIAQGATKGVDVPTAQNVYDQYTSEAVTVEIPTGNPLKMNFPADVGANKLTLPSGGVYKPAQFHWHYPSENTYQDAYGKTKGYAGELHVVHVRTTAPSALYAHEKPYLVLNAFFTLDASNSKNDILTRMLAGNGQITGFDLKDADTFGPIWKKPYYRFQGGLTTPPCSEAVEWFSFETPYVINQNTWMASNFTASEIVDNSGPCSSTGCTATSSQEMYKLQRMRTVSARLNRPTQPLNGRVVLKNTLSSASLATDLTIGPKANVKKSAEWTCGDPVRTVQSPIAFSSADAVQCAQSDNYEARVTLSRGGSEVAFGESKAFSRTWNDAFVKGYNSGINLAGTEIENTGYGFSVTNPAFATTYQVNYPAGQHSGLEYIEFRFPSEHIIDGVQWDGDILFVHDNPADTDVDKIVLSVPVRSAATFNDVLSKLGFNSLPGASGISGMPIQKGKKKTIDDIGNMRIGGDYYEYTGSMTRGDNCGQSAKWFIFKDPTSVNPESIKYWYQNFGSNARPIQGTIGATTAATTTAAAHRSLSAATTTAASSGIDYTISSNGYSSGVDLASTGKGGTGCSTYTQTVQSSDRFFV